MIAFFLINACIIQIKALSLHHQTKQLNPKSRKGTKIMKYYDVNGKEISKSTFTQRSKEIRKSMTPTTLICTIGKTGTGETYKRLLH